MSCEPERLSAIRPPVRQKDDLLAGKKLVAIIASGGSYKEPGLTALDHEVPYLRFIFGFMGITDVKFIQASGTGAVAKGRISPEEFLAPYLNEIPQAVEQTDTLHLQ
jgi:FMN-dependent NADH-azoreductase